VIAGNLPAFSPSRSFRCFATAGRQDDCAPRVDVSISALSGAVTSETLASLKATAPPGAVRVLDRNDSHRFWFRAAPDRCGPARLGLVIGNARSIRSPQQFARLFNNWAYASPDFRSIQTALVEDFCAGRESRISVQDRSEF